MKKKRRGRPKIGKRYIVRMSKALGDKAKRIGNGNISKGIRHAVEIAPYAPLDDAT